MLGLGALLHLGQPPGAWARVWWWGVCFLNGYILFRQSDPGQGYPLFGCPVTSRSGSFQGHRAGALVSLAHRFLRSYLVVVVGSWDLILCQLGLCLGVPCPRCLCVCVGTSIPLSPEDWTHDTLQWTHKYTLRHTFMYMTGAFAGIRSGVFLQLGASEVE